MPMHPADKAKALKLIRRVMFLDGAETATINAADWEALIDPVYDAFKAVGPTLNAAFPEPAQSKLTADQKKRTLAAIIAADGGIT